MGNYLPNFAACCSTIGFHLQLSDFGRFRYHNNPVRESFFNLKCKSPPLNSYYLKTHLK